MAYSRCIIQSSSFSLNTIFLRRALSSLLQKKPSFSEVTRHEVNATNSAQENRVTYELPKAPPSHERKTFLQLFSSDYNLAVNVIGFMNAVKFTPYGLKKVWRDIQEHKLYLSQKYLPERAEFLGPELATAHFICYRGGKVKFYNKENWYALDEDSGRVENLPNIFNSNFKIEAVNCSKMKLIYEGFENIKNMECPKWFNFEGCPHIDDWCLDRVAGEYGHCIEHLNIKDCPEVTENGIACLSRMPRLKTLTLGGHPRAKHLELVCLMLEDVLPDLSIRGIVYCDESLLSRQAQPD